jgi:hypothetical protein
MERLQAFQYELIPTGDQQREMLSLAGSCRSVFSKTLALPTANPGWPAKRTAIEAVSWNPPKEPLKRPS